MQNDGAGAIAQSRCLSVTATALSSSPLCPPGTALQRAALGWSRTRAGAGGGAGPRQGQTLHGVGVEEALVLVLGADHVAVGLVHFYGGH